MQLLRLGPQHVEIDVLHCIRGRYPILYKELEKEENNGAL